MVLSTILLLLAVMGGAIALVAATASLWGPARWLEPAHIPAAGIAFLLHTASLVALGVSLGGAPVLGVHEGLSFMAWVLLVLYLVIQWRTRVPALGAFLLPVVVALGLAALLTSGRSPTVASDLRVHWLALHAALSFLGLAAFAIVFALSTMFLLQERSLKRRQASRLGRILPSLERCDRLIYQTLSVGFPLLTLGIFSGLMWAATREVHGSLLSPKTVFPVLAWVLFAVVLWARFMAGWRGRRLAWAGIGGFLLAMLAFLGIAA